MPRHHCSRILVAVVLIVLARGLCVLPTHAEEPPHLGYGTTGGVEALGFDWIKTLGSPAGGEARKLVRIDLQADDLAALDNWLAGLESSVRQWAEVADAYEIGNEPNLDAASVEAWLGPGRPG